MTKLLMYFSNICVLARLENIALAKLVDKVAALGIDLEVRHFGLGQKYYMNDYFQIDKTVPDIIVSTDLEVFENRHIFDFIQTDLIDIHSHFELKQSIPASLLWNNKMLPFLSIPLVFCYNDINAFNGHEHSLESIIKNNIPLTYGGINNSGAKCILKVVAEKYGIDVAESFISKSTITDMPIQAFNRVKKGQSKLALVPSIYAASADGVSLHMSYPDDGAVALPSFISVKKGNHEAAISVIKTMLSHEFCKVFTNNGQIYCGIKDTHDPQFLIDNNFKMQYPSAAFLNDHQTKFYELYASFKASL